MNQCKKEEFFVKVPESQFKNVRLEDIAPGHYLRLKIPAENSFYDEILDHFINSGTQFNIITEGVPEFSGRLSMQELKIDAELGQKIVLIHATVITWHEVVWN